VLTDAEIKEQMGPGGEISIKCWKVIWRLLRQLENKMYRGSFLRWRHIFPPELAVQKNTPPTVNVFLLSILIPDARNLICECTL
jgi:hypothetical protein